MNYSMFLHFIGTFSGFNDTLDCQYLGCLNFMQYMGLLYSYIYGFALLSIFEKHKIKNGMTFDCQIT